MHLLASPARPGRRPSIAALALLSALLCACGPTSGPSGGADGGPDAGGRPDANRDRPDARVPVCGDGERDADEACDDGNLDPGDGCDESCALEADYACPTPGQDCVLVVVCGNGRIEGDETCDDRNLEPGDGCSDTCQLETGWTCPVAGTACAASECGDGVLAGFERCDDGNTDPGDGCDESCALEPGYHCPTPGAPCEATVCGDGVPQGTEDCDDGNQAVGDGCTPFCELEPQCADGTCVAVCGDGVRWDPEECDDGNNLAGDGCSDTCQIEQGFVCEEVPLPDPPSVSIPLTVRDFVAVNAHGFGRLPEGAAGAQAPYGHPDFEWAGVQGMETGLVAEDLDAEGKPVRTDDDDSRTTSDELFAKWYRDDPAYNHTIARTLTLDAIDPGVYQFDSVEFFPADGDGFTAMDCQGSPCEVVHDSNIIDDDDDEDHDTSDGENDPDDDHDFHFTTEVRYWFEYSGTEVLAFSGDDDVWVFINGKLTVDLGGLHSRRNGSVTLADEADRLGLEVGGIYEAVVFHAERHTTASQYRLTLTNFNRAPSTCADDCGDGVVSSREACDDGPDNGGGDGSDYGGCSATCVPEPYCGDGIVQPEHELCDDGLNLGGDASACAPGCQSLGAACGDGVVQTDAGEGCDDGNTDSGDGCSAECQIEID